MDIRLFSREIVMIYTQAQNLAVAIAMVVTALGLMALLDIWLDLTQTPYLLFFASLTLSAWYGGRLAGIFATFLAALAANYFFVRPTYWFDPEVTVRTVIFIIQGVLISVLCGALKVSQAQTRTSLQQLRISQKSLRRLLESNIIGVVSCDRHGAITEANAAFLQLTGFTQADVVAGRVRWDAIAPLEPEPLSESSPPRRNTTGLSNPHQTVMLGKDGHRIPIAVGATLLESDSDTVIRFVLDLTQLKQAEQRLSVQFAVTRVLAEAETLDAAVPTILQALCESLGWQLGVIWQVDAQNSQLCCVKSWHTPQLDVQAFEASNFQQSFPRGVGLPGQVWAEGRSLWLEDLSTAQNFPRSALASQVGLKTVMGFPILLDQDVLGVIECFSTRPQTPNEDLLQLMTAIGSQIGQYMERKRTEEALKESQELFQQFMNYSPATAYIKDEEGRFVYGNELLEQSFGTSLDDILGKKETDFFPAEAAQVWRANDRRTLETGEVVKFLETAPLADGTHSYISFKFPLVDRSGQRFLGGMAIDITDRIRIEEALRESEQRFRLAARAIAGMVYDWNVKTGDVFRSEGLHGLIGIHPNESQTDTWWAERIHPEDYTQVEQIWPSLVDGSQDVYKLEYRIRHRDRHWVDVWDQGYIIRDEAGEMCRVVGSITDISERKQAEAERERLLLRERRFREEAERANRIKDEFLAVLSHELRSPLNPILGWTRLLRSRQLDAATTDRALETIERNAQLQTQLIEDLLDVSRILRGKLLLNVAPVHLIPVIEDAIETVRLAAEAKGIQIHTHLDPSAPPVLGDAGRLQQIVWNLLSNAVKFTPGGGSVTVVLRAIDAQVQIQVKDTGRGISPAFLPHVFDYFRQDDSTTTRQFGGLGLGLAIVRHLTELHGGTIQVESPGENQGATFTLCLPHTTEPGGDRPLSTPANSEVYLAGVRVLVVDDEPDMRELASFILGEYGATVQSAASAAEALHYLDQAVPDVLVSDIGMPDMDGYGLLGQVRGRSPERGGEIPAIALTAYAGEYNQQQALQAGFQIHIAKPVDPKALVMAIVKLLGSPAK